MTVLQILSSSVMDDLMRFGGLGIGGWIAVQTYLNGKSLSRIRGTMEGINGVVERMVRAEEQINNMPRQITEARDSAVDRVQELISGMEERMGKRVEQLEERRRR